MKIRFLNLALISFISSITIAANAGGASEAGGARFHFQPNLWKVDEPKLPSAHITEVAHSVRSGSVPSGSSFLGLEPNMLTQPQVQMRLTAKPSFADAVPKPTVSKVSFNPAFGKAGTLPTVAALPPASPEKGQMIKQSLPSRVSPYSLAHHSPSHANKIVHGAVKNPKASGIPVQDSLKKIDSYSTGYVPGTFLPSTSSIDGLETRTFVHGRVLYGGK